MESRAHSLPAVELTKEVIQLQQTTNININTVNNIRNIVKRHPNNLNLVITAERNRGQQFRSD